MSDAPVCVPVKDPPKALLDALSIVPVDPIRGDDGFDVVNAVFEDPLRPEGGMEDGALRPGVALEPRLVEGKACVSAELVDKPLPLTVVFANAFLFPLGTHGADNPLLGVCTLWLGWPALPA